MSRVYNLRNKLSSVGQGLPNFVMWQVTNGFKAESFGACICSFCLVTYIPKPLNGIQANGRFANMEVLSDLYVKVYCNTGYQLTTHLVPKH